jgi:hypothetical protein
MASSTAWAVREQAQLSKKSIPARSITVFEFRENERESNQEGLITNPTIALAEQVASRLLGGSCLLGSLIYVFYLKWAVLCPLLSFIILG